MIWNYDHFSKQNVKTLLNLYTFRKFIFIFLKLTLVMKFIGWIINIFKNMLQKKLSKIPFYEKVKMFKKRPICSWILCHHWFIWLCLHPINRYNTIPPTYFIRRKMCNLCLGSHYGIICWFVGINMDHNFLFG